MHHGGDTLGCARPGGKPVVDAGPHSLEPRHVPPRLRTAELAHAIHDDGAANRCAACAKPTTHDRCAAPTFHDHCATCGRCAAHDRCAAPTAHDRCVTHGGISVRGIDRRDSQKRGDAESSKYRQTHVASLVWVEWIKPHSKNLVWQVGAAIYVQARFAHLSQAFPKHFWILSYSQAFQNVS